MSFDAKRVADLVEIHELCSRYMAYASQFVVDKWLEVFTPDGEYGAFGTKYPLAKLPELLAAAPRGQFIGNMPVVDFERETRGRKFEPGVGLPGRVWSSGRSLWVEDARADPNFPRAAAASAGGLRSGFAVPVPLADRVLGVIEFFSRAARPPDTRLLATMGAVGSQLGQFIERTRAEEAFHAARVQLQIVTDTMSAAVTRSSHSRSSARWAPRSKPK